MTQHFARRALAGAVLAASTLTLTATVSAQGTPAAARQPASPHEQALAAFFLDTRVVQIARGTALASVKPGYQRQLVEYYFRQHSDADLAAAYAGEIAASVSPQDSAAALRVARLPQMRKMMAEYEKLAQSGVAQMTATDTIRRLGAEVERAAKPADLQAMGRMTPLSKGMVPFLARRIKAQDNELARQFKEQLVTLVKLSVKQGLTVDEIPRARLGFAPIDRIVDIYAVSLERMVAAVDKQARERAELKFDTLFEPRHLVDRAGIERGRRMVEQEAAIGQAYVAEIQDMYTTRVDQLRAAMAELPGYVDREINGDTVGRLEHLLATGENYQRRSAVYRRMLAFAESRIGSTKLEDEKLVFATDEDLAIWRGMAGEVDELARQDVQQVEARHAGDRKGIEALEKRL